MRAFLTFLLSLPPDKTQAFAAIGNIFLTFGLLVFGGMQWWVARSATKRQRAEFDEQRDAHRARQQEDIELAFQVLFAEKLRVDWFVSQVSEDDIIEMIGAGMLRPDDIAMTDVQRILASAARFGNSAAFLTTCAVRSCRSAGLLAVRLNRLYEVRASTAPRSHGHDVPAYVRTVYGAEFAPAVAEFRRSLEQAAGELRDAVDSAPNDHQVRIDHLTSSPVSIAGKELIRLKQEGRLGRFAEDPPAMSDKKGLHT